MSGQNFMGYVKFELSSQFCRKKFNCLKKLSGLGLKGLLRIYPYDLVNVSASFQMTYICRMIKMINSTILMYNSVYHVVIVSMK